MIKMTKALAVVCLAVCILGHAEAGEDGAEVSQIGRRSASVPWLPQSAEIPHAIVRYDDIAFLAGLPAATDYYEIDPEVVAAAYSYFFHVKGKRHTYIAGSFINLAKLCHELAVLEEIEKRNKGKEVASGMGQGLKSIGTGLGNLVVHPGLSLKSAGDRFRQTGRSLERAVGAEDKVGRDASGVDRSHLGSGPAGADRRKLAFELGVDVYTSNPVMQQALIELSQLRAAGGFVTWAIPYDIGMLSMMNPMSDDANTESLIRDFAPYELRRQVGKDLEPLLGMNREDSNAPLYNLLMNPNYTPRTIAYIGLDLSILGQVANLPVIVQTLAAADTADEADVLALALRLYSFFHRRVQPLREFIPYQTLFAAKGANNVFYFLFFGDTLRPWDHTRQAFDMLVEEAVASKADGMEIWTVGDVHPALVQRAAERGVRIKQNILHDPQFFPVREQRQ